MHKIIGNRVLIETEEVKEERVSDGGIIIHVNKKDDELVTRTTYGTIVDYGPTAWLKPELGGEPPCGVGDRVVYARHGGKFITLPDDERKYILVYDEDVLMILESKDE